MNIFDRSENFAFTWALLLKNWRILFAFTWGELLICCWDNLAFSESRKLCPGPLSYILFAVFVLMTTSSEFRLELLGLNVGVNLALNDAIKLEPTPPGPRKIICLLSLTLSLSIYNKTLSRLIFISDLLT